MEGKRTGCVISCATVADPPSIFPPLFAFVLHQANKWIRAMEGKKLRITDLKMKDFLREVESGISYGLPVLLQDVLEELDPSLEPVLSKAIMKQGSREFIRLGDKVRFWRGTGRGGGLRCCSH